MLLSRYSIAIAVILLSLPVAGQTPQPAPYPNQPSQYPAQPAPYPNQPAQYPAQPAPYPTQPAPYPTQPAPYYANPPAFSPDQLDNLVSRIALYPDPLLAQVLTAATYPDEIPLAAAWAMQHRYLTGDALSQAIAEDRLYWQPSVMALLPFPDLLDMMARDPGWTQQLGAAVLAQDPDVMNAVQRMRQRAMSYGYLRSNQYVRVIEPGPGIVQIVPVDPGYFYVPVYNPAVVFAPPPRGVAIGGFISFGPRIFIGASFAPFGWVAPAIDWHARTIVINGRPWTRDWHNRVEYVHPYGKGWTAPAAPRIEHHETEIHAHAARPGVEHAAHAEHDHR